MKKIFFFAIATLGMMVGCQKTEIDNTQKPIDDSERVAVQFGIDAPSLTVTRTKGAGAVEEWASQELYILGYEKSATDYSLTAATTLIPNIMTEAPATSNEGAISVKHPEGDVNADNESIEGEPYFYADTKVYDFYGYYVDDAADPATELTANTAVTIDVEIDGTQDIMVAKADAEKDIEFCTEEAGRKISANNAYSAYAARRGVHPTLTFEHMLTRFNFYVVAGAESGTEVNVTGITLDSYTNATLTVAPTPGLEADENVEKVDLELDGIATDGETPYASADYKYVTSEILENKHGAIGKSIMAIAGETSHNIVLTTVFNNGYKQDIKPLDIPLNAYDIQTKDNKPVEKFEAGYQYDIILTVYGPEEVEITAVLSDWKEGGNTTIDPDEWMEEPTEVSASLTDASETSLTYEIITPNEYVDGEAYLTDGTNTFTQAFVPTKAKTAEVTFDDLTPGTTYTFSLKVRTSTAVEFKDVVAEEVEIEAVASNVAILGSLYAFDKDSYNKIPAYYRTQEGKSWSEHMKDYDNWVAGGKKPYAESGFDPLPWLVVWYLPMETTAELYVNDYKVFDLPADTQLATIAARELGLEELAGGDYKVTIKCGSESASTIISVPCTLITDKYLVEETEKSYNQLPEAYRAACGEWADYQAGKAIWEADKSVDFNPLPWLAVEVTPGNEVECTATNGTTTHFLEGTVNLGVVTFAAREMGLDTLTPGDWTVTVQSGEVTESVIITVPAE